MGIYLHNMEMPKSCGYCFALDDYGDYPVCQITKEQRGYNFPIAVKRMDNCPLVPLPPHGRLIDADALVDSFDPSDFWNPDAEDNCFAAIHVVNCAPTIIPAEEGE